MSEEQLDPTGVPAEAPGEPDFQVPAEEGAVTAAAPPSRRAALMRSGLIIGVLVVVFGIILPQFIDYADVIAAFKELTAQQVVIITVLGAIAWFVSGLIFSALIPRLSAIRGTMSWLILGGIGASVPFGPWNMGVLWVVVRGWGVGNAPATSGIALYGVVNELSRLSLPLFAIIVLAANGELAGATDTGTAWTIAIICAVAFVVVTALIIGIVRSERIANWFGRTGQRIADWVLKRLNRTGSPNVDGAIHKFRDQMGEVIRRRGFAALAIAIVSQVAWILVLTVALRMVGVPEEVLPFGEIFAVYALVLCITIIPLSPGGAGVTELLMISAFSALAGPEYEAAVAAGVLLYRIYFWFIPIPIAWILLKVVRRGKSMLPTTAELRAYAKGDAAGDAAGNAA